MNKQENAQAVSLKDYIIDISENRAKPAISYEVVLENNTDFIIRRQTSKSYRELVILISQELYYIRDSRNATIDTVNDTSLRNFLRDLRGEYIQFQQVRWIPEISRESIDYILRVITNSTLADMCRHNIAVPMDDSLLQMYLKFWEQNKKLFVRLTQMFPRYIQGFSKYQASLPVAFWIEEKYGANEALYFAEKLAQSGIRHICFAANHPFHYGGYSSIGGFTEVIESDYKINLRRFIDYICFDLYRQGYADINRGFFDEYKDYLSMQMNFYGKIREKYPENFKTAHDVMALKVNLAKETEQCKDFTERASAIKELEYAGQSYCIVVPTEAQELAEEGINLSHCVGDYIGRVAAGECSILFLRRRRSPEQSLVTLQLIGSSICQAQGLNRRDITEEERRFLLSWGRQKNIQIAV